MATANATRSLREIREARGLSIEALGVLVGRNKSTVSRIERGLIEPTPETVVALAQALGMSAARARRLTLGRPSILINDARPAGEPGAVTEHHAGNGGGDGFD